MKEKIRRKIILEDGREFYGYAFGSLQDRVCEIVFNTSMAGYQEILSDLSYTDQAVVMTYPLIGNYGMAAEDYESEIPSIGAMIVREYNDEPSNFRSRQTLGEVMEKNGIPGITGVDTRALTRSIRDYGTRKALLADASMSTARGLEILQKTVLASDAVSRVSCRQRWESPPLSAARGPGGGTMETGNSPLTADLSGVAASRSAAPSDGDWEFSSNCRFVRRCCFPVRGTLCGCHHRIAGKKSPACRCHRLRDETQYCPLSEQVGLPCDDRPLEYRP